MKVVGPAGAHATWFGPESAPLFGVVHLPAGGRARGGVVICPPLGKEHVDTYRGLKLLAQQLCERGFVVLRFDYRGTGDSSGELGSDSALSDYQQSIHLAVEYLRSSGVARVGLVGLRMGALLAAVTVDSISGVSALVLWDPVVDGRRYLREQRTLYKMTVGEDVVDVGRESILGTTFSPASARQFRALRMPVPVGVAAPMLVVSRPERADDPAIQALAATSGCELVTVAAQAEYVEPVTFVVEIPVGTLTMIADWLHRNMNLGDHPVAPVIRRRAKVAQLSDGRAIVETLDELGPNRLFAIRTALAGAGADTPTLLIHNTATEHRVGSGRVWTDTAREFAARGLAAVRYDRRGTGDTGTATADFATIYSADSTADVRDAMLATGVSPERLMMTGICSGAWNSAIGAMKHGARLVVLVNVILYSVRHKAIGPDKLIGMTPPNPGVGPVPEPRTLEARAKKLIRRWLPYPLWLVLGLFGLTEVPEVLLAALHRKGVVVDMVMSPEDYVWFDKQRGRQGLARLARRGWSPTIALAPTGDHPLLQRDIQNVARDRLLEAAQREFAEMLPQSFDRDAGRPESRADDRPTDALPQVAVTIGMKSGHLGEAFARGEFGGDVSTAGDRDLAVAANAESSPRRAGGQATAAGRNTAALLLSRLAISVMGWSGTVLIARLLSPTDWGIFSFVFGLLGMMSIVTDLGVGRVVLGRLLTADDDDADVFASSFVGLRAALGLLGYAIAVGYVVAMGYSGEVIRATALAGLVVVIATPSHALSVLYQSRLKMVTVAAAEAFAQLFQLLLTVLIATTHPGLLIFILPAIANEIFSGTWKLIGVRRGAVGPRISRTPRLKLWREMLVEAVSLSVGLAMMTLLSKVDVLLLAKLDHFDSVGLYSVAYKFADVLSYAVVAIVTPLATLLVAAWPSLTDEFRHRVRSAAVTVGMLTALAVVGMWACASDIVSFLYGERFGVCADAVRMLLVGAVFAALSQVILVALVSAGRQRAYPWVALGALVLNVGLNVVLIPHFSYNGSAAATVITQVVMFIAMWALVARTVSIDRLIPAAKLGLIVVLAVSVCALSVLLEGYVHWVLVSTCAGSAFVFGAFALRVADPQVLARCRLKRAV